MKCERSTRSLCAKAELVVGAHLVMALCEGAVISFGVFLTNFMDDMQVGSGVIGAASSTLYCLSCFLSPVATSLAARYDDRKIITGGAIFIGVGLMLSSQAREPWQLFLSHSCLSGIGMSMVYVNTIAAVGRRCKQHISLATGITTAGTSTGVILLPLLTNLLKRHYSWRISLLVIGGITLTSSLISCFVFKTPEKEETRIDYKDQGAAGEKERLEEIEFQQHSTQETTEKAPVDTEGYSQPIKKSKLEMITASLRLLIMYPRYGMLILISNITFFAFFGVHYHLVASAITGGIPEDKATILMSVLGVGTIVSRLLYGVPISLGLIKPSTLYILALALAGTSAGSLPFCTTYTSVVFVTLSIAFALGMSVPLLYVLVTEAVGIGNYPKALGLLLFLSLLTSLAGGFLAGWIYDTLGSYDVAFYVIGGSYLSACIIMIISELCKRRGSSKEPKPTPL